MARDQGDALAGTLAGSVLQGQRLRSELGDAERLVAAARAVVEVAEGLGLPTLVPASQDAASLVGAAVALGNGSLRSRRVDASGEGSKYLVVEAVAVSGYFVRQAVTALRKSGADWVGAYVAHHVRVHDADPADSPWGDVDVAVVDAA